MNKPIYFAAVMVLGLSVLAQAQVTKPVITPDPANRAMNNSTGTGRTIAGESGAWTCTTTCGGTNAKAEKRKVKEAVENSDKNCSGKGSSVLEAIDRLKTHLDRDGNQDTEHAPNYQCEGCEKNDLSNAICKNQNTSVTINYRTWIKTKSPPESQKTSP
jgi:hypothetical protein